MVFVPVISSLLLEVCAEHREETHSFRLFLFIFSIQHEIIL